MPTEHQRIHEVSGVGFHVTTRRPDAAGMPIAFLHGYMSNAAIWSRLAACLDVDAPMLFIDLPGSGRSPSLRRVSDLSATALAGRLCELLVRLDVDRCHLVGAQMGGSLAAYMLALDARRFDKP